MVSPIRLLLPLRWCLVGVLCLGLVGCPKKSPPPPVEEPEPARPLVDIDSVAPFQTPEGEPVTVTVKGYGFVEGTEVYLGSRRTSGVDVIADDELTFRASDELEIRSYDLRVVTPKGDQAVEIAAFEVVRRASESSDCTLKTVLFEFNEVTLTSNARQLLSDNASCIQRSEFSKVRLEGHADERGSTEYNLSLGQRRAESVKAYLANLGVLESSVRVVSYGEERPAVSGFYEDAWRQNRRVEFVVP